MSRQSGRCDRRRRSPASGTGGGGAARCEDRRALRQRAACGLWRGGASGSPARHGSTSARESRACACGGGRWAGRCALHEQTPDRKRRAAEAAGRSIDEALEEAVIHRRGGSEKTRKRAPPTLALPRFPQLWKEVWTPKIPANTAFLLPARRVERRLGRCYARRCLTPSEEAGRRVEHQIELTAGNLWDEVSSRLKGALNEATFEKLVRPRRGRALRRRVHDLRPERLRPEWIEGHFLGLIRAAVKDATGHERGSN